MRGRSPANSSRGRPGPAIASRSITATMSRVSGECWAKCAAPTPPSAPPSVERKTIVCAGLTRRDVDGVAEAAAGFAYERASSIRAAVPEALSFAPEPPGLLSLWATTTIAAVERPGTTATRFWNGSRPRPATSAVNRSARTTNPYGRSWSANHVAAPVAPAVLGARSGCVRARSSANCRAPCVSNAGGRSGRGSGAGRVTVNAASRSGKATSSQVPRYVRPLTGRSSEPRRARRRRRVGGAADMRGYSREAAPLSGRRVYARAPDHPARRRRGRRPEAPHVPARARRFPRRLGPRRRGSARRVRGGEPGPRRPRHHAAAPRRARGVQAPARPQHRPDHHAHRPRRRAGQGRRARARSRRLHHEAVLDPRVQESRARTAPAGEAAAVPGRGRGRGDLRGAAPDRPEPAHGRAGWSIRAADVRRVRAAPHHGLQSRARVLAEDAARGAPGRLRLPRAADDRRARPASAREARARPARAGVHPHRARCRVPLPRAMNPFNSVGAKLSLALAGVVALALGLVYLVVVPSLRQRLVDAKLRQLEKAMPRVASLVPQSQGESWSDFKETASARADARIVVYEFRPAVGETGRAELGGPFADTHGVDSSDVVNDRIAQRAADTLAPASAPASGTVSRGETDYAEVAALAPTSVLPSGSIVLLSASLHDALANVHTVQRRLLEAGILALVLALAVGYGAAYLFARRIRRLEAAAERIAAGRFDEPVTDRSADELGQLARAFDRMRVRLSQLERARREFIGNASHELRTPLFSLSGFIELLTDEELDDATGHELELDADEAQALGDEGRVLRIGRALLENACKHTPSGTRVFVRSTGSSLAVIDEGAGIPSDHAGHVFDRFYRVGGTHASGSGLGLAIARELAEAMGGSLELESSDSRTAFTLRLPPTTPAEVFPRESAI